MQTKCVCGVTLSEWLKQASSFDRVASFVTGPSKTLHVMIHSDAADVPSFARRHVRNGKSDVMGIVELDLAGQISAEMF